jgi:hypothetical protein
MRKDSILTVACATLMAMAMLPLMAQQPGATAQPGAGRGGAQQPGGGRGFTGLPPQGNNESIPKVPVGFVSIFNGKNLTGWHVSKTNHHGTTPDYHVVHDSVLIGTQNPIGQGGILLTDTKYKNVDVYMEVKPDWGCDSGLFLRSNEAGAAYQVTLDYLPGSGMGGIYGERLEGVSAFPATLTPEQRQMAQARQAELWQRAWKREEWNSVRARITGNPPHITAWINDQLITDFQDTANHAADGAEDGLIGIQAHGGARWVPGGFWRWRVIAVKELP